MGPRKAVVLAGYRTVKEALVNHAEEFGDREVPPVIKDSNLDHGDETLPLETSPVLQMYSSFLTENFSLCFEQE